MSTTTNINTQNQVTTTASVFNQSNTVARNNNEFKTLDKSKGDNRALASEEKIFINKNINDFKNNNKTKYLNGDKRTYTKEETKRLLTLAGKYIVDKDTQDEFDDNNKDIGINEFSKDEINNAINYLNIKSQGLKIKGNVENPVNRDMFSATQEEFIDKDFNFNTNGTQIDDAGLPFIPSKTIVNSSIKTGKIVVKGTKKAIDKLNKIDDDVGRYVQYQKDKLPSNKFNNWITKETDQNVVNDIFNESLPPSTGVGVIVNTIKEVSNNQEKIIDTIKNTFNFDNNNSEE